MPDFRFCMRFFHTKVMNMTLNFFSPKTQLAVDYCLTAYESYSVGVSCVFLSGAAA